MPPTLNQLRRRHPEHRAKADYWKRLDALVKGGSALTDQIKRDLLANPDGRPESAIKQRIKVARYFNKISPILSRFLSQLFAETAAYEGSKDKFWGEKFFKEGALLSGDDDGRASFQTFLVRAMLAALSTGKAIAQIDTRVAKGATNKLQQREYQEDEPYLLLVPRWDLWDWETDRDGFKFAKVHRFRWARKSWDSDPVAIHDFTTYQRTPTGAIAFSRYAVIERKPDESGVGSDLEMLQERDVVIEPIQGLKNVELFNLKGKFKFPIVTLNLPPELWVADQLHDPQVSHFNIAASAEWGILTSNYSMAAVKTPDPEEFFDRNKRFGEGYYLLLQPEEDVNWLERPGGAFDTAMRYREIIEADIDKTVQQIAIAAKDAVSAISGEAIRQARRPEQLLLLGYGALVKEFAECILDVASIARGEDATWKCNGFDDFTETSLTTVSTEYAGIQQAQIPSPTFNKEMQKAYVRDVAKQKDFDPKDLKQMLEEIDNPPESEEEGGTLTEEASGTGEPAPSEDLDFDAIASEALAGIEEQE